MKSLCPWRKYTVYRGQLELPEVGGFYAGSWREATSSQVTNFKLLFHIYSVYECQTQRYRKLDVFIPEVGGQPHHISSLILNYQDKINHSCFEKFLQIEVPRVRVKHPLPHFNILLFCIQKNDLHQKTKWWNSPKPYRHFI